MKRIISLSVSVILTICAALSFVGCDEAVEEVGIRINEIVASNNYSLTTDEGASPDWIEIYNGTNSTVNLSGYGLTDDDTNRYKYTFPSVYIEAGGYLVVLAETDSGQNDGYLRTDFKLSSAGEDLILSDPQDTTVDTLKFDAIPTDISYGRDEKNNLVYFGSPTPGEKNSGPTNTTPEFEGGTVDSDIVINEFMNDNKYSIIDEDGDRSDWVEIKNTGGSSVNISGYGLSDIRSDTKKWAFPDITLEPGEIIIVFLSSKDKRDTAGNLHASFSLGATDEALILSDSHGRIIDSAILEDMGGNVSKGKKPDSATEWVYFPTPTPGKENTTKYFEVITEATDKYLPDLSINEVKTVNTARSGEAEWVELINRSNEDINLEGYGLSDDLDNPFAYTFGDKTISAGGFFVVDLGKNASSSAAQALSLSYAGDDLYLTSPDGTVIDTIKTGLQRPSVSVGRLADGFSNERVFFTTATKGAANNSSHYTAYSEKPVFSREGGYASSGEKIEISAAEGAKIYYTLDGSKPTNSSTLYTGAITITKSTPVRAIAYEDGKLASDVATENFLVEEKHDIPVVCIAVKDSDMFGNENGIYAKGSGYVETGAFTHTGANYWKDWEREISFEFFEADGSKGVEFPAGISIFGQYSREEAQKSLAIHLRGSYGLSSVTYPFFRDYDVTNFSSLILRTSGQDWDKTKLRDAFFTQVVKDTMNLDYMEYRPVAVYINGEYWGLYNLREKQNEGYLKSHYGIEEGTVDIIKGNSLAQAGDKTAWMNLREYTLAQGKSYASSSVYEYICSIVDVDEFIEYIITETFFNNTDTGNIRMWKPKDGGKWRWMLFDLDWGLFSSTYQWNMIEEFFDEAGHGVGNAFFSHVQTSLLKNSTWKNKFIKSYAWHLNNTFNYERMEKLLDAMAAEIRTEMARNIERWGVPTSVEKWESNVESLKQMMKEKIEITKQDLKEFFNLSDSKMKELFG